MFESTVPLNPERDRELRFKEQPNYAFAAHLNSVPISVGECRMIAREYPIVFSARSGEPPLALLGTTAGVNAHYSPRGIWMGRYVPAHIRRYPFVLAAVRDEGAGASAERTFQIRYVPDAPHFSDPEGGALFDEQGQPAKVLKLVQNTLGNLQKDFERTTELVQQIEAAGLLKAQEIGIRRESQEDTAIRGVRVIDDQAFAALDAETLKALHTSGALSLIHAHLISALNLRDGILVQRIRHEETKAQEQARVNNLEELFSDADDELNFDFDS